MRVAQTNTRGVVRQGRRAGAYRALPMGAYAVLQRWREVLDVRVKLRRRNRRRRVNRQPEHSRSQIWRDNLSDSRVVSALLELGVSPQTVNQQVAISRP